MVNRSMARVKLHCRKIFLIAAYGADNKEPQSKRRINRKERKGWVICLMKRGADRYAGLRREDQDMVILFVIE